MAITPRARSASPSDSSLFSAPRSLKEAVNCRFSNFRKTSAPTSRESVRLCRQGVCSTAPAMRCAAARMSSMVTGIGRSLAPKGRHEYNGPGPMETGLPSRRARARWDRSHPTDELFRLLVTSVTDYAIYLLDPAGRVVSWNVGAERIKGYAAADIARPAFLGVLSAGAARRRRARGRARARRARRPPPWRGLARAQGRQPLLGRGGGDGVARRSRRAARLRQGDARHERAPARARERDRRSPRCSSARPSAWRWSTRPAASCASTRCSCACSATATPSSRTRTLGDLTHPEDAAAAWRTFEELVQGRRSQADFEQRMLRAQRPGALGAQHAGAARRRRRTPALHHRAWSRT